MPNAKLTQPLRVEPLKKSRKAKSSGSAPSRSSRPEKDSPSPKRNPIEDIRWVNPRQLQPNGYNPNSQDLERHALLIESIKRNGWTQPIVVRPLNSDDVHVIVDGEHRWRASLKLGVDTVPIVVIEETLEECMAATVRHNRARGQHGVEAMSAICKELEFRGHSKDDIAKAIGATDDEVDRLLSAENRFIIIAAGRESS